MSEFLEGPEELGAVPQRMHRPRESLDRCALRAQLRGDPMLGTAFPAARLLLVEQPGPWGPKGLTQSRLDPDIAAAVERRANADGIRVQAVRRPGRTPRGASRHWLLADTRDGREAIYWGRFADDKELLDLPLDGSVGRSTAGPIFLVCAHSKHDACCALRGKHVAAALNEVRPSQVLETTHLGGDRFAANVLVLPTGLLYGRVLPFAAKEFCAAAEADEVVGALLRGRIGVPPPAQAALAFAYEHLALRHRRDLRVESTSAVVGGVATVRLAGPHGAVDVTVRVERVPAVGLTCNNPAPNRYLRYRPVGVAVVD